MVPIIIVVVAVLVVSKSIEAQTVSNYPAEIAEALEVDLFAKINTGRITNLLYQLISTLTYSFHSRL